MINFPTKELTRLLDLASAGISKKDTVQQGDSFVFRDGKLHSFNDEIAVTIRLPDIPGVTELRGAINAKRFSAIVKAWSGDSISIALKGESELSLTNNRTRVGMRIQSSIMLPIGNEGNPVESQTVKVSGKEFITAVKAVLGSMCDDAGAAVIHCVHIGANGDGTFAEATDGYQVCRSFFTRQKLFDHGGYSIPANAVRELVRFTPESIGTNGSWLHFECGDTRFACRTIALPFPQSKMDAYIATPDKTTEILFKPENLEGVVDRVGLSAGTIGTTRFLQLTTFKDRGTVRFDGSDQYDWAKELVEAQVAGDEDRNVAIEINHLREALALSMSVMLCESFLRVRTELTYYAARLLLPGAANALDETGKSKPKGGKDTGDVVSAADAAPKSFDDDEPLS